MSRYKLFSDKLINMLTPNFERGRGHILWLQSLIKPLQDVNDSFQIFTNDKIIEANVSSQVYHFEWYLNYKFKQFFSDQNDRIKLFHYVDLGVPFYEDGELNEVFNVTWGESEEADWIAGPSNEEPKPLYYEFESLSAIGASFRISVPDLNLPDTEFDIMLKAEVEKYRISGKTYTIEHT